MAPPGQEEEGEEDDEGSGAAVAAGAAAEGGEGGERPEDEAEADDDEKEGLAEEGGEGGDGGSPTGGSPATPEPRGSPLEQRIVSFEKDRDDGMKAYQEGDFEKAVEHWSMARGSLKYVIDKEFLKDEPEKLAQVKLDQYKMHLNLAQGFLRTGEFRQTIEYAGRALTYDADSEKALYRTCVAWKELSQFGEARSWIARLLAAHPDNAAAKQLLQEVGRLEKASAKTARKAAQSIFQGMAKDHDHRTEPNNGFLDAAWSAVADLAGHARRCCRRQKAD